MFTPRPDGAVWLDDGRVAADVRQRGSMITRRVLEDLGQARAEGQAQLQEGGIKLSQL